jgi:hypothetical protein
MRKELLLTLTLLAPVSVPASTVTIEVQRIFKGADGILATCSGKVDTACTKFDGAELSCACVLRAESWRPEANVMARPKVFMSHGMYLRHEMTHISDFDQAVRQHVAEIEAQSFTSRDACEGFLAETRVGFPTLLRAYVRASTLRRDRQYPDR